MVRPKVWSDRAGSRGGEHRLSRHSTETAKPSREGLVDRPAKEHDLQGKSAHQVGLDCYTILIVTHFLFFAKLWICFLYVRIEIVNPEAIVVFDLKSVSSFGCQFLF